MRESYEIAWNKDWYFGVKDQEQMDAVVLPHTNCELPLHYFDDRLYQFVSCYKKTFRTEEIWKGQRVWIRFDGVAHVATVYLNGISLGVHEGGYTAFEFELTEHLHWSEENELRVEVDSRENLNLPPFGNVIDYMTYGGIYREVSLLIRPSSYIKDVFVTTTHVEDEEKELHVQLEIDNPRPHYDVRYSLRAHEQTNPSERVLGTTQCSEKLFVTRVDHVNCWTTEAPALYWLVVRLYDQETCVHEVAVRFGFRECAFKKEGFYLNGKKIKLLGLNRHQAYPYVGYAMPKRPQQLDADILKYELGLNAVRTSHYPQSKHFIERCDELGLLVFTEIPGWQHIGDEAWQDVALKQTEEMILQYRNYPSIILWGVRINESQDDDRFYKRTNAVARRLDQSRATGGVRFIKKSSLLEDVYTYNDFSHNGKTKGLDPKKSVTPNVEAPYLISEYNGHMYPTKGFDQESRRLEHAKRHANVIDALFADDTIAGGFGWCMFDYNTHKDFGSGDRICYHGVMNMFRVPKLAASVYSSQFGKEDVLTLSSSMDIGEHPGGSIGEVLAFTNAECVKLYKNDVYTKTFYPDRTHYPHMPHPPIVIDDFIGELMAKTEGYTPKKAERIKEVLVAIAKYGQHHLPLRYKLKMLRLMAFDKLTLEDGLRLYYRYVGNWGDVATTYRLEAIRCGKVTQVLTRQAHKQPQLRVTVDTTVLVEKETYDVATVRIEVVDGFGQMLPYFQEAICYEVTGELELIGPSVGTAIGGGTGTYVRTVGRTGSGTLRLSSPHLEAVTIQFEIQKI